jgi:hypothetical protein
VKIIHSVAFISACAVVHNLGAKCAGAEVGIQPGQAVKERQLPTSLTVVAVLFIIGGVLAVLDIIASLTQHRIEFNFGVLGFFIGPGLLRLSRGWRTCALVFTWIGLIVTPIFLLALFDAPGPLFFTFLGTPAGTVPKMLWMVFIVSMFLLCLWQYRVLTREDVRELFSVSGA